MAEVGGQTLPEVLRLRERCWLSCPVRLTQEDRVALRELNSRLKGGEFAVAETLEGTLLQAQQFIGVFSLPSYTIHVEPKTETPAHNVLFMALPFQRLHRALPPAWQHLEKMDNFLEQLAELFVAVLRQEMGRGLLRRSQLIQEDSPTVRGRLRVTEYLRQQNPTRLPVQYPDLTADHPVNRLLATALRHVVQYSKQGRLRGEANLLFNWFADARVQPFATVPRKSRVFTLNRLQARYQEAVDLAWLLLTGVNLLPSPGTLRDATFAVDMDKLFESFLTRTLMVDVLKGTGFEGFPQGKTPSGPMHLFRNKQLKLKPDLVVWQGEQPKLIIDFKNKRPDGRPEDADLYQMYAYARHLGCPKVLLLYPGSVELPDLQTAADPAVHIVAAGIDLKRDLRTHYADLVQDLRALLATQGVMT